MNGNRSRYSSTPTFNMQKRGLFKKSPQLAPERPDFGVQQDAGAVPQTLFSQPAPVQPTSMQGPAYPPSADLFSTPGTSPIGMLNPMGGNAGFQPSTFQSQPQQMQNTMPGAFGMQPPQQQSFPFGQPASNLPPLGNQNVMNQNGAFSPRAQGFTPPQMNQPVQQPLFGGMNPSMQQPVNGPTVQPANPFDLSPLQQPQQGFERNGFAPQQGLQMQPAGYTAPPAQPMDPDTLWKLFLFVLLPVLFVPCLFVPDNLNVIRYLFIALSVAGIGVIWFRKMFTDNGRIIATLVYVAACIVLMVMLFAGSSPDAQQGDPNANQQQAAQTFGANGEVIGDAAQPTFSPTPEPTPTVAPISEAQTRLEAFMTNWSGARIEDMVRLVQPSWASNQDNPSNRLFVMLGNRTPLNYTIEEISGSDSDSSRTVTMTANIDKNNGKDPTLYRFMVLMVKEGGEWYVDPNSLASNDEVKNSEETNVVNDSQNSTAENWTIAPRQTVTPAPPASQLLYYNPDGGSKYHLDQYCPSIYDEFLPLEGSFPYAELGNHRDLTPCLRCNAPTQTLPPEDLSGT